MSAIPQEVKVITSSPLVSKGFRARSGPSSQPKYLQQACPSLGLRSLVFLFLGLWTLRRPGVQPASSFPQGPQIVTSYVLYRICCFIILGHCIHFCYMTILPQTLGGRLGNRVNNGKGLKSTCWKLQNSHRDVKYSLGNSQQCETMCGAKSVP